MNDLKFAFRQLLKNPGFTAVAVLTLALGIGANTAIFSVVNAVLLRPLPFKDPDRLITLWERNPAQGYEQNMPATGNFMDWQEENRSFEGMAMFDANVGFAMMNNADVARITGARISANLFQVLGVNPILGRSFAKAEEISGRSQVAIISHGLWQRRCGGDPNLIGKPIFLDSEPVTVVGIMPPKFKFPGMTGVLFGGGFVNQSADVWVPLPLDGNARQVRGVHSWQVIARLKSEVSLAQAAAEMDAIQQRLEAQYRGNFMGTHVRLVPLRTQGVANVRLGLLIMFGAVAFVLLIACANVANLLLARAMARQKEIAVRLAIGAARVRLIRQLLTESLVLAIAGAALGLLLAHLGIAALVTFVAREVSISTPGWENIAIDRTVLGFVLLTAFATTVIFGLAPAWHATQTDLQTALKDTGRSSTPGAQRHRLAGALVSAQIGLTLMLLLAAGLLIQTFSRLQKVSPGFKPAKLLTMQVDLPDTDYREDRDKAAFFERLLDGVKGLPGVESVGMTMIVPFGGAGYNFGITVEGQAKDPTGKILTADWRPVTPDYFRTMGVPLIKGRNFTEQDRENTQRVIMVNESFARSFLPGQEPLGKRVAGFGDGEREIIGVVGDFKQLGLNQDVRIEMYTPQAQTPWFGFRTLVLRTKGDPISLAPALRSEVRLLDPHLPITKLQPMQTLVSNSIAQPRFRMVLLSIFGGLALALAAVGIYGVLAYTVNQRRQEIGIRMALGAQRSDVLGLVLRYGMKLAVLGVVAGLFGGLALTRVMRNLLFGVSPTDPLTFAGISLLLTAVALIACWIPARRATRVDPVVALRQE